MMAHMTTKEKQPEKNCVRRLLWHITLTITTFSAVSCVFSD